MDREITFAQAINEATDLCLAADPAVYVVGLGAPDPKGIFGTTAGLQAKYGPNRVMDMPCAENAMTGIAVGSALVGMRPVMTHQRVDFALLALKTMAFGFFIAIVTCYHGLAQPLRLEDVSRVAVRAVTQGVIVCVLIDAVFIVLYLVT